MKTTHNCHQCDKETSEFTTMNLNSEVIYVCEECLDSILEDTYFCEGCNSFHSFQPAHMFDVPYMFINNNTLSCATCALESFSTGQVSVFEICDLDERNMPIFDALVIPDNSWTLHKTVCGTDLNKELSELNDSDGMAPIWIIQNDSDNQMVNLYIKTQYMTKKLD